MDATAENSTPAAPERKVPGRPFKAGQSGNPGGRPKGLAATVREMAPASELVAYFRAIWFMDEPELERLKIPLKAVTLAERNKAGEWLTDRGYGKAPAHAPVEGGDPLERDSIDERIGSIMEELAAGREGPVPGEAASGELAPASQAGAETA